MRMIFVDEPVRTYNDLRALAKEWEEDAVETCVKARHIQNPILRLFATVKSDINLNKVYKRVGAVDELISLHRELVLAREDAFIARHEYEVALNSPTLDRTVPHEIKRVKRAIKRRKQCYRNLMKRGKHHPDIIAFLKLSRD